MPNSDDSENISVYIKAKQFTLKEKENKTAFDYLSLAISTCGVGFIPVAPGTWGSAVGVLIYLFARSSETRIISSFSSAGFQAEYLTAWVAVVNLTAFILFCFAGIKAATRAAQIFNSKDPQKIVIDEVLGQLMVFLFVPLDISWKLVFAGFILFRIFDIWKPYPVNSLENLPSGLGVCADDILAGVYGGICLAFLYAIQISFWN